MVDVRQERPGHGQGKVNRVNGGEMKQRRGANPRREADNDMGFSHHAAELHAQLQPNKPGAALHNASVLMTLCS